ncbi:hypothetical protein [Mesorhizobium sp. 113-3-3]|uniref:hypothetical protein n=1 Tax=Mesorhizobium sp. 113-3-3 TaxID=2744516 RepID=UPI001925A544|nr:hypothetical protein [Mesorhizobium sp. 113-3-3]BCG83365.1 hypothetical protein MesoLj113b_69070 [Mesorhizobium sp. 113-3-3]
MTAETLPRDSTLATVLPGLVDAEEYVRRIFERMRAGKLDQVRIGIKSGVECPDYLFDEFFKDESDPGPGQPVSMQAYNGKTHRPVSFEKWANSSNWATVGMTTVEVQRLLGDIRGWPRSRKRPQR